MVGDDLLSYCSPQGDDLLSYCGPHAQLATLTIQFGAAITQSEITACAFASLVRGNVAAHNTFTIVMIHLIRGWLIGFIQRVECWYRWHGDRSPSFGCV